jgi:hypothetical protein
MSHVKSGGLTKGFLLVGDHALAGRQAGDGFRRGIPAGVDIAGSPRRAGGNKHDETQQQGPTSVEHSGAWILVAARDRRFIVGTEPRAGQARASTSA